MPIVHNLQNIYQWVVGAELNGIRIPSRNNRTSSRAEKPYCTICTKIILDVGVDEFVLWHEEGARVYDTKEYDVLSVQFGINEKNSTVT